jgi:hypothetical protein
LWRHNPEFRKFAESSVGRSLYIARFLRVEIRDCPYALHKNCVVHCTYLFDKYNSVNDQPALIHVDGVREWHQNGKLHRDNDQPAIICADGAQSWYQNDQLHRDNISLRQKLSESFIEKFAKRFD